MKWPQEFLDSLAQVLPIKEVDVLVSVLDQSAHTCIRLNPKKSADFIANGIPVPWSESSYYLSERPSFILDPLWHAGVYYVQDASSTYIEQIVQSLDLKGPIKILDLCAAPGGKSTHIVSLLPEGSLLVTNEVIKSRASILKENIQRWGYGNCIVTNNDPKDFKPLAGVFDIILVDAPCSGEGLFRKQEDAIDHWSPNAVEHCSQRQQRILNDIWSCLTDKGHLIYSTCTYNKIENERVINRLLKDKHGAIVPLSHKKDWNIVGNQHLRFMPHKVNGEGFSVCLIQKHSSDNDVNRSHSTQQITKANRTPPEDFELKNDDAYYFEFGEKLHQINLSLKEDLFMIDDILHIVYAGTELGKWNKDFFKPSAVLAVSVMANQLPHQRYDLSIQEALQYLKGEALKPQDSNINGWIIVTYKNIGIGWVKFSPNKGANHYPKHWRIRQNISTRTVTFNALKSIT